MAAGDRLTPDEVDKSGISARPTNDSGLYLGAGLAVGQGRTTEGGATPGLAFLGHVEPGYQVNRGEFGRLEFGVDLFAGTLSYRMPDDHPKVQGKVTQPVPFGLLLKAGYGYSLGGPMYGILNAGVGPVVTKYQVTDTPSGITGDSGQVSGLAWEVGWRLVAPMAGPLDFTFGIDWMQIQADVGKLDLSSGGRYAFDQTSIVNIPSIEAGLRLRL
jgi:hypothetical protein